MALDKYYLNLAGEYRVCAELLKRGILATVTFGNMKGADIVAVGANRRAAIVEVKASNSTRFVTKFYQRYKTPDAEHPTFWVLYSVRSDGESFSDRFFILSHHELGEKQAKRNCADKPLSYLECVERFASGVDNVLLADVLEFEDKWQKIIDWCSNAG